MAWQPLCTLSLLRVPTTPSRSYASQLLWWRGASSLPLISTPSLGCAVQRHAGPVLAHARLEGGFRLRTSAASARSSIKRRQGVAIPGVLLDATVSKTEMTHQVLSQQAHLALVPPVADVPQHAPCRGQSHVSSPVMQAGAEAIGQGRVLGGLLA